MGKGINVELTARQTEIADFIAQQYYATGTGVGYREICRQFGFEKDGKPYPNAAKTHVDALLKKGAIVASFEENEDGTKTVKANSLRPANALTVRDMQQIEPIPTECSRIGEFHCLNIVNDGKNVAFVFFYNSYSLKSDVVHIGDALKSADDLRIPKGEIIDRLDALAAKLAAKEIAKMRAER